MSTKVFWVRSSQITMRVQMKLLLSNIRKIQLAKNVLNYGFQSLDAIANRGLGRTRYFFFKYLYIFSYKLLY